MSTTRAIRNPASNKLPAGVSLEDVRTAVTKSGYPLQTIVAESFGREYQIKQEWAYIDRESNELRTLDLLACREHIEKTDHDSKLRAALYMLVECKQSEQPFIFFLSESTFIPPELPSIVGLRHSEIELAASPQSCRWDTQIGVALSLYSHPFVLHKNYCFTFSKMRRQGKRMELSGSEAYGSLVLPLVKGLSHLATSLKPKETFVYLEFGMTVAVAVIDGPMIGIRGGKASMLPWVRVLRYEHDYTRHKLSSDRLYSIDVVHKDFFTSYRDKHLMPFIEECARRAFRHEEELVSCEATLSDFTSPTHEMESYLRPWPAEWNNPDLEESLGSKNS